MKYFVTNILLRTRFGLIIYIFACTHRKVHTTFKLHGLSKWIGRNVSDWIGKIEHFTDNLDEYYNLVNILSENTLTLLLHLVPHWFWPVQVRFHCKFVMRCVTSNFLPLCDDEITGFHAIRVHWHCLPVFANYTNNRTPIIAIISWFLARFYWLQWYF